MRSDLQQVVVKVLANEDVARLAKRELMLHNVRGDPRVPRCPDSGLVRLAPRLVWPLTRVVQLARGQLALQRALDASVDVHEAVDLLVQLRIVELYIPEAGDVDVPRWDSDSIALIEDDVKGPLDTGTLRLAVVEPLVEPRQGDLGGRAASPGGAKLSKEAVKLGVQRARIRAGRECALLPHLLAHVHVVGAELADV